MGAATADDNPVLVELLEKGVAMPDGSHVKLPAPAMADGMDAEARSQAIARVAAPNPLEQFTQKYSSAPITIKIRTVRGEGDATFRTVDLWFVAHGKWETLVSDQFADGIVKTKEQEKQKDKGDQERILSKAGFLTPEETAQRKLASAAKAGQEERYFYTTFTLFDRVKISATRYALLSKSPSSIVLAARLDPRLTNDPEYPNQWRSLERDAAGKITYGKVQPYQGAGFYVKITRLTQPADSIFVEYHSVFWEPTGWFDGENLLRAKLPTIAQHEVKQFRGKLAKASLDAVGAKP